MPIYEFHCDECDKDFECLLIGSDKPKCPDCNTDKVRRLLSACGFVSKGAAGTTVKRTAATSGCAGCSSTSCGSCGH